MTKKQKREQEEKAALRKRLKDMAMGAYGAYQPLQFDAAEFGGMASEMGLEAFGRWLGAIENGLLSEKHKDLTAARYLVHYETLDAAVGLLWFHGIQA